MVKKSVSMVKDTPLSILVKKANVTSALAFFYSKY
jgi:hypothetical protein